MSIEIVTLAEAKEYLRIDSSDEDAVVTVIIAGATASILNFLGGAPIFDPQRNPDGSRVITDGEVIYTTQISAAVKSATLIMCGYMYTHRDEDAKQEYEMGFLPRPVMALLNPIRKWAIA